MTQEKIYSAEDGHYVGKRTVHATDDGLWMWVWLEGRPFECIFNEYNNKFEV